MRAKSFIYTFYALTLFAFLLIPALIGYLIITLFVPYRQQIRWVYTINQRVVILWSILVGMRYKCIGKEYLDTNSAQIVIFNHYSLLDMFAINRHFVIAAKPLIKKELLSIPILGWLFRMTAIPIDRNSSASKQAGFIKMKEELDKGISILIFPEGTRNRTTKPLNPFKDGAFRLAIETNTAIQPAVILNTRKLAKPNSLIFKPGTIIVQYLPPIFPKDFDNNLELFIEHCYKKMEEAILKFESSIGTKTKE